MKRRGKGGRGRSVPSSEFRVPSSKKKILFLEYFPFIAGGQNVLLAIISNLKKEYDIEVLLFNRGEIESRLKALKIKYHFIQAPHKVKYRYFFEFARFNRRVLEFVSSGGYDLIYSSGYFSTKLIAPAVKKFPVPLIWHKHQIIEKGYFSYLASQVRHFSKFADKMICVSNASKLSLIKAGVDPRKVVTIHNGMQIPKINGRARRAAVRKIYGIKNEFTAGTVGFFRRNKGLGLLIGATELLKGKGIKFIIVGKAEPQDAAYEEELRRMAKGKGLGKNVIFAGFHDRFDFLPAFDVFVLPSFNEPFALSVLEALGAGVPVVAFNSGGTPEAVKDGYNGYLAEKIDAKSLAGKILEAKADKKLKQKSRNASAGIKKVFSIQKQMEEIKTVIEECVK
jgi:glycosyltransferase involved in cell wall biosynthesis